MQVLICNAFSLKMPTHAPNGRFLGDFTTKWKAVTYATRRTHYLIGRPIFAQLTLLPNPPQSCALQWERHSPKNAPSRWGICTRSNTWFLGSTRLSIQNDISISSAVFAGLTTVIDQPKDHITWSVIISHIELHSTVMLCNHTTIICNCPIIPMVLLTNSFGLLSATTQIMCSYPLQNYMTRRV